jgi:hypothetical protein
VADNLEIWRTALRLIQEIGADNDPKGHAMGKASECYAKGETEAAIQWVKVANAMNAILEDVPAFPYSQNDLH